MNIDKNILAELKAEQQKPKRTELQSRKNYFYRAFADEMERLRTIYNNLESIAHEMNVQGMDAYDPVTNQKDTDRARDFVRMEKAISDFAEDLIELHKKYGKLHHDFPEFNQDMR